jgi:hypothetical protein
MSNGRGALECCYCGHYRCHNSDWVGYDAAHEAGECLRHRVALPATTDTGLQRVCRDFQPNEWFGRDSAVTADERLAFFPQPLAPGILFGFSYCWPPDVRPIFALAPGTGPDQGQKGAAPDPAT